MIWVAILGLIVLYIYALVAFAFFRASFDPDNLLYCHTLYECVVTIIRFGLVGDIDEVIITTESQMCDRLSLLKDTNPHPKTQLTPICQLAGH